MSKLRSVNTHFWSDNYVIGLDPIEKLVFLYLLTNEHTNMLGAYELHITKIAFDTGNPLPRVRKALEGFERDGKIAYVSGFIIFKNFLKHQNLNTNMQKSAINSFNKMPPEAKKHRFTEPLAKALEGFIKGSQSLRKEEYELEYELEEEYELERESVATDVDDDPPDETVDNPIDETTWYQAVEVAQYLQDAIVEFDPEHRLVSNPPSLQSWHTDIDRAIRLDNRTEEQLKFLINYIFRRHTKTADFWKPNIQSGKKLREHFDTIKTQIKTEVENGKPDSNQIARNAIEQISKLEFEDA